MARVAHTPRYSPVEDWTRWCSRRSKKLAHYKGVLKFCTKTRNNTYSLQIRLANLGSKLKTDNVLLYRTHKAIESLNEVEDIIDTIKNKIFSETSGWIDHIEQNQPKLEECQKLNSSDSLDLENDVAVIDEFTHQIAGEIHDWDSSDSEY